MDLMRWTVCVALTLFRDLRISRYSHSAQDAQASRPLLIEIVSRDKPLPGASVVVNGRTQISDAAGRAVFDVPLGEYDVAVEAKGHLPGTSPRPS